MDKIVNFIMYILQLKVEKIENIGNVTAKNQFENNNPSKIPSRSEVYLYEYEKNSVLTKKNDFFYFTLLLLENCISGCE